MFNQDRFTHTHSLLKTLAAGAQLGGERGEASPALLQKLKKVP